MFNLSLIDSIYIIKYLMGLNFNYILLSVVINSIVYLCYINSIFIKFKRFNFFNYIKYINIISIIISFFIHLIVIFFFKLNIIKSYDNISSDFIQNSLNKLDYKDSIYNSILPSIFNLSFSLDFFGLILLALAYIVGFISVLTLDSRLNWDNNLLIILFNIFILIIYIYISSTNIFLFFICYELLLIPSFIVVYFMSPSRRAIQASLYFIIWTQLGSLFVLASICYIVSCSNSYTFIDISYFNFSKTDLYLIFCLLFLGFGFKVPVWPFHYWLTKTHVEAPSGFSIYLSGFLVKTALFGFYTITSCIYFNINTIFFFFICVYGTIDASLKMWGQTDLKKLVAYCTIQEMNIIYLLFCTGDSFSINCGIFFSVTHAILSALMFFLVDCIYRRFQTRSIVEINGFIHIAPNLGISVLGMLIFFAGLPGTAKFTSEFYLFTQLFEISPTIALLLFFFMNVIGMIGFGKCWFNAIFGLPRKKNKNIVVDLSIKELYIIILCGLLLILITYYSYLFW